jgi:hypothetical protein
MNDDQFSQAIASRLDEYFDGYVLIGFKAGVPNGHVIIVSPDNKTSLALQALTAKVLQAGHITVHHGPQNKEGDP